jgi:hypothetical protein
LGSYRSYNYWTMAEQKRLERLWPTATWAELRDAFPKRTLWSLQCKAQFLGVKRPIGRPRQRLWTQAEEGQINALDKKIKRAEKRLVQTKATLRALQKERQKHMRKFSMRLYRVRKKKLGSMLLVPYQGKERKEDRNIVST